jgi:hypothetical protein
MMEKIEVARVEIEDDKTCTVRLTYGGDHVYFEDAFVIRGLKTDQATDTKRALQQAFETGIGKAWQDVLFTLYDAKQKAGFR